MNLCKERINNRTRSLREKFSRHRSYSELSFKDVPSTTSATVSPSMARGSSACSSPLRNILKSKHAAATTVTSGSIIMHPMPEETPQPQSYTTSHHHFQNESYCSALDLTATPSMLVDSSCLQQQKTFTTNHHQWQHDVAIQCDLLTGPKLTWPPSTKTPSVAKSFWKNNNASFAVGDNETTPITSASCNNSPLKKSHQYSFRWTTQKSKPSAPVAAANALTKRAASFHHKQHVEDSDGDKDRHYERLVHCQSTSTNSSSPPSPTTDFVVDGDNDGDITGAIKENYYYNHNYVETPNTPSQFVYQSPTTKTNNPTNESGLIKVQKQISMPTTQNEQQRSTFKSVDDPISSQQQPDSIDPNIRISSTNSGQDSNITMNRSHRNYFQTRKPNQKQSTTTKPTTGQQPNSAPNSFDGDSSGMSLLESTSSSTTLSTGTTTEIGTTEFNVIGTTITTTNTTTTIAPSKLDVNEKKNKRHYHSPPFNDDDELYNFDTVHRLLNISLQASSENHHQTIPYMLELSPGGNSAAAVGGRGSTFGSTSSTKNFIPEKSDHSRLNSRSLMTLDVMNNEGVSGTGTGLGGQNQDDLLNVNLDSTYLNLPSPNIQSEIQDVNPVLRKLSVLSHGPPPPSPTLSTKSSGPVMSCLPRRHPPSTQHSSASSASLLFNNRQQNSRQQNRHHRDDYDIDYLYDGCYYDDHQPDEEDGPPLWELKHRPRRRALVPPKLITDDETLLINDQLDENIPSPQRRRSMELQDHSKSYTPTKPETNNQTNRVLIGSEANNDHSTLSNAQRSNFRLEVTGCCQEKTKQQQNKMEPCSITPTTPSEVKSHCQHCHHEPLHSQNSNSLTGSNMFLGSDLKSPTNQKNRRRSSVVVIPPMQICPGDLLVYSKVLTQRANMMEGTLASKLLNEQDHRKSHKNTWSLLRLFDRSSSRSKTDQIICGLEEFLSTLKPSNSFVDETMLRFKGISWNEFTNRIEQQKRHSNEQQQSPIAPMSSSSSRFMNGLRLSSLQSNALDSIASSTNSSTFNCPACCNQSSSTSSVNNASAASLNRTISNVSATPVINPSKSQTGNELPPAPPNGLQRTDSVNTESEVESILEHELGDEEQQTPTQTIIPTPSDGEQKEQPIQQVSTTAVNSGFCRECFQQLKREKRRREALWELFQSELYFLIDHLMVLKNVFMEPLKNIQVEGYAMFAEPELLFGNLDELCLVTYAFCKEFLNMFIQQQQQPMGLKVMTILNKLYLKNNRVASSTQAYHRYTLNYINALQYLETLRRQLEFIEFEKWCNRDPRCKKLQLTDLLVAPVQHVMRVPLLLKEIENKTHDSSERRMMASIIERQEHSLRELDDKMRWLKNFERLLEIQRNIIWPSVLDMEPKVYVPEFLKSLLQKQPCERLIVSPRRQIILEGPLMVIDSGKPVEMYVFLFDDLLLITRRKKGLGKKQSTLTERWVTNCSGRSSTSFSTSNSSPTNVGAGSVSGAAGNVAVVAAAAANNPGSVSTAAGAAAVTAAAVTGASGGTSAGGGAGPISTVTGGQAESGSTGGVIPGTTGMAVGGTSGLASGPLASTGCGGTSAATINSPASNILTATAMAGEPNHGPLMGGGGGGTTSGGMACFKYMVYKQPLSLDRFYIHDVPPTENYKHSFVLVCLNRFQQVITVHTFQAASDSAKNIWLTKLRSTCDRWKRTLQSQLFKGMNSTQQQQQQSGKKSPTACGATCRQQTKMEQHCSSSSCEISQAHKNEQRQCSLAASTQSKQSNRSQEPEVACSISYKIGEEDEDESQITTSTFTS